MTRVSWVSSGCGFVLGALACILVSSVFQYFMSSPAGPATNQGGSDLQSSVQPPRRERKPARIGHASIVERCLPLVSKIDSDEFLGEIEGLHDELNEFPIDQFLLVATAAKLVRVHGHRPETELALRRHLDGLYGRSKIDLLERMLDSDLGIVDSPLIDDSARTETCIKAIRRFDHDRWASFEDRAGNLFGGANPYDAVVRVNQVYRGLVVNAFQFGTVDQLRGLQLERFAYERVIRDFPNKVDGVLIYEGVPRLESGALAFLRVALAEEKLSDDMRSHIVAVVELAQGNIDRDISRIRHECLDHPPLRRLEPLDDLDFK